MGKWTRRVAVAAGAALAASCIGGGAAVAASRQPDLVVTSVGWSSDQVAQGEPLRFWATIENRGNASTPAGVVHGVGFQVDGALRTWSDDARDSLAPGQSVVVTAVGGPTGSATWAATAGNHELLAYVDDAKRIPESNEGNNRTKVTLPVHGAGSIRSTTLVGGAAVTTLNPTGRVTGLASSVSGTAYGACVDGSGVRRGPEQRIGEYSAGGTGYYANAPFGSSGIATAAAGARQVTSAGIDPNEIAKYHYGAPQAHLNCPAGTTAGFTRLHATRLKTVQYSADGWSTSVVLGAVVTPVSADLHLR